MKVIIEYEGKVKAYDFTVMGWVNGIVTTLTIKIGKKLIELVSTDGEKFTKKI